MVGWLELEHGGLHGLFGREASFFDGEACFGHQLVEEGDALLGLALAVQVGDGHYHLRFSAGQGHEEEPAAGFVFALRTGIS